MIVEKWLANPILSLFFFAVFALNVRAEKLPDLVDLIKPSVVAVGTYQSSLRPPSKLLGTGFVVGDGQTVITNYHVVDMQLNANTKEALTIFAGTGTKPRVIPAKLLKVSQEHDLAVLRIQHRLPALDLARPELVREGTEVVFTGFPIAEVLGLYPVTHRGMISSITPVAIPAPASNLLSSEKIMRLRNPKMVYQLDATAYPGNSGSPVFDTGTGEVIGVINMVHIKETKEDILSKPSGVAYAIPVQLIHQLLQHK